jgi:hypothetical protein
MLVLKLIRVVRVVTLGREKIIEDFLRARVRYPGNKRAAANFFRYLLIMEAGLYICPIGMNNRYGVRY